jgi:integrase/recombinase XerD
LQSCADHPGQGSLKPASQNQAITALKACFPLPKRPAVCPLTSAPPPNSGPTRDALAQRVLEESEVALLIEAAPQGRNRVLLKLLHVSGVRVSEICGLKWCDALPRQQGGQITVFGKGGKTRTVHSGPYSIERDPTEAFTASVWPINGRARD